MHDFEHNLTNISPSLYCRNQYTHLCALALPLPKSKRTKRLASNMSTALKHCSAAIRYTTTTTTTSSTAAVVAITTAAGTFAILAAAAAAATAAAAGLCLLLEVVLIVRRRAQAPRVELPQGGMHYPVAPAQRKKRHHRAHPRVLPLGTAAAAHAVGIVVVVVAVDATATAAVKFVVAAVVAHRRAPRGVFHPNCQRGQHQHKSHSGEHVHCQGLCAQESGLAERSALLAQVSLPGFPCCLRLKFAVTVALAGVTSARMELHSRSLARAPIVAVFFGHSARFGGIDQQARAAHGTRKAATNTKRQIAKNISVMSNW